MRSLAVALVLTLAAPAAAQRATLPPEEVSPFPAFMVGEWVAQDGERWTEETWADRGARMIGLSREGRGDVAASRESLAIEPTEQGLVYLAQPGDAPAVAFAMVSQDALSVEFANPGHDYPQRIRYWRDGDTLRAEISLIDGSRARQWSYRPKGPLKP